MQLLVVEDDPLLMRLYQSSLASRPCLVTYVASLSQARSYLYNTSKLDGVLLDNQLMDEQGLALVPEIRALFPYSAILMVSASTETNLISSAFRNGIDDYVLKPMNQDLLWIKIEHSVASRRLQQRHDEQQQELKRWVDQALYEQQLATHVFNALSEQLTRPVSFINSYRRASTVFSGDILLHQSGPDGSWYLLLADSMGHGLSAAISLLPLLEVFAKMAAQASPLSNLVLTLNQRLCQQLPDDRFVAAVLLRIDPDGREVEIWNGGMPDLMLIDKNGRIVDTVASRYMPLGILEERNLDIYSSVYALNAVSHLIGYTDGVTDSACLDGSFLSPQQILDCWQGGAGFAELIQRLDAIERPNDDLTVFQLDINKLRQTERPATTRQVGEMRLSCELHGPLLANYDHTLEFLQILQGVGLPQALSHRVYTVLCELYLNAFEHGVLGLDSMLKQDANGFVDYYQEKKRKSLALTDQDSVYFSLKWNASSNEMEICVRDSGQGFDFKQQQNQDNSESYFSGRGISMIRQLCQSLIYSSGGQEVTAKIKSL